MNTDVMIVGDDEFDGCVLFGPIIVAAIGIAGITCKGMAGIASAIGSVVDDILLQAAIAVAVGDATRRA